MKKTFLSSLSTIFIMATSALCPTSVTQAQEFVIQPKEQAKKTKKLSVNELKERIGTTAKEAFDTSTTVLSQLGDCQINLASSLEKNKKAPVSSTSINQSSGELLKKIATIQMTFSQALEKLINNQKPFKKAGRADLEHALTTITQASVDMTSVAQQLHTIATDLQKESTIALALEKTKKSLEQQKVTLSAIDRRLATDSCLKRS